MITIYPNIDRALSEAKALERAKNAFDYWLGNRELKVFSNLGYDSNLIDLDPRLYNNLYQFCADPKYGLNDTAPRTEENFYRHLLFQRINSYKEQIENLVEQEISNYLSAEWLKRDSEKLSKVVEANSRLKDFYPVYEIGDPRDIPGKFNWYNLLNRSIQKYLKILSDNLKTLIKNPEFKNEFQRLKEKAKNANGSNRRRRYKEYLSKLEPIIKAVIDSNDNELLAEVFESDSTNPFELLKEESFTLFDPNRLKAFEYLAKAYSKILDSSVEFLVKKFKDGFNRVDPIIMTEAFQIHVRIQQKFNISNSVEVENKFASKLNVQISSIDNFKVEFDDLINSSDHISSFGKITAKSLNGFFEAYNLFLSVQKANQEGDLRSSSEVVNNLAKTMISGYDLSKELYSGTDQLIPETWMRKLDRVTKVVDVVFASHDAYLAFQRGESIELKVAYSFKVGLGIAGLVVGGPVGLAIFAVSLLTDLVILALIESDWELFHKRNYFGVEWDASSNAPDKESITNFHQISFGWKYGDGGPNFLRQLSSFTSISKLGIVVAKSDRVHPIISITIDNSNVDSHDHALPINNNSVIRMTKYSEDKNKFELLFAVQLKQLEPLSTMREQDHQTFAKDPDKIKYWHFFTHHNILTFDLDHLNKDDWVEVSILSGATNSIPANIQTSNFLGSIRSSELVTKRIQVQ